MSTKKKITVDININSTIVILKALYQHIVGQENENVRIRAPRIAVCDVGITPLSRAGLADVGLRPRSGERTSEINIARILSDTEESIYFSFRYLVFISVLTYCHKVCKVRSNDRCGRGRCYAASNTVCA